MYENFKFMKKNAILVFFIKKLLNLKVENYSHLKWFQAKLIAHGKSV